MLFASDDTLRAAQRQVRRRAAEWPLTPEQERREFVENERELRMHQRTRLFAWLLFIVPAIVSLVWFVLPPIVMFILEARGR